MTTYRNILRRQENPKGAYNKLVPGTRPLRNFALPMILCNLTLEMAHLLEPAEIERTTEACVQTVMGPFLDPGRNIIVENVGPEGQWLDSFEGRLLNPGHAIEAMWFMMDLGRQRRDRSLVDKAVEITLSMLEVGWDAEFGGIFYFLDRLGLPASTARVGPEAVVGPRGGAGGAGAGILAHMPPDCWEWFGRVHAYTWAHFPDPAYGEWFGYLNRRGEVLLPLKGGKWKGCFHIPRGLLRCGQILGKVE